LVLVAESVLTVIFQQPAELTAQKRHVAMGAFFLPVPEPPPEALAELVLRLETSTQDVLELPVRVLQVTATHIALAFVDAPAARAALAPIFEAAKAAPPSDGATWVFWGRTEPTAREPAAQAEPVDEAASVDEIAPADEAAPVDETAPDEGLLYERIRAMTSQEKMQLALKGDRAARLLLIKDVNKTIHTFLLQNPRITIDEIRYIAGFRQANPEALVSIAAHREWGQNQNVIAALVRNPKTPTTTAVKLLDKVGATELRRLAKSNEVPRAVQAAARKRVTE
jgi:hypothetical protein